ncbi:hypothetical protein [Botrimarina mediterranea]|uniref:Uncharacterized protein n=2 Tax=Botrimarina mediterranea TaxID=2528022 RepID=A0A518KE74_9BACT|nr:hypothetical protein [Botrimarina mediterranea]QDV76085.1 hypothetical protein Spa11_43100 [Botrimarina mediterranea]QDV80682.1 hypothetical protein K2D_43120 [Planctomycetes bacterium K2D]
MLDVFRYGSVLLGDRLIYSWNNFVLLRERGVDAVFRFTSNRNIDFRLGERLGPSDHIVVWPRPTTNRLFAWKQFMAMPASIPVRECRVSIAQPGLRSQTLVLATTLLDAKRYPEEALAQPQATQERYDLLTRPRHVLRALMPKELSSTKRHSSVGRLQVREATSSSRCWESTSGLACITNDLVNCE